MQVYRIIVISCFFLTKRTKIIAVAFEKIVIFSIFSFTHKVRCIIDTFTHNNILDWTIIVRR